MSNRDSLRNEMGSELNAYNKFFDNASEGGKPRERVTVPGVYKARISSVAFAKKDGTEIVSPTIEKTDKGVLMYKYSFETVGDVDTVADGSIVYESFPLAQPTSATDEKKQNTANLAKSKIRDLVGPEVEIHLSDLDWLINTLTVDTAGSGKNLKVQAKPEIAKNVYLIEVAEVQNNNFTKMAVINCKLWEPSFESKLCTKPIDNSGVTNDDDIAIPPSSADAPESASSTVGDDDLPF